MQNLTHIEQRNSSRDSSSRKKERPLNSSILFSKWKWQTNASLYGKSRMCYNWRMKRASGHIRSSWTSAFSSCQQCIDFCSLFMPFALLTFCKRDQWTLISWLRRCPIHVGVGTEKIIRRSCFDDNLVVLFFDDHTIRYAHERSEQQAVDNTSHGLISFPANERS